MSTRTHDVVVVGAGPNGLTAATLFARAGLDVLLLERNSTVGGGCRTEELTRPGFRHDTCAAIHPMAAASPAFRALGLEQRGVRWRSAPFALAHPLDDGRTGLLSRNMGDTAASLEEDGTRWQSLFGPFIERHRDFFDDILKPVRVPRHPLLMARFGTVALRSAEMVQARFRAPTAKALFAGCAAHAMVPLSGMASASFGLVLGTAGHVFDWPCAEGGSQAITNALAAMAMEAGCTIRLDVPVTTMSDIPPARAVVFDVTPRQLLQIAGSALPAWTRRQFGAFRYGPGVFKIDYALSAPIPWRARACGDAATVHVGGTANEVAEAEVQVARGEVPERPFVLVAQQSRMDPSRAPAGHHTGWAYCHVPHGCEVDMTSRIERQIERFAPGFRDVILERHVLFPADVEHRNANMIGGDIGGGANTLRQTLMRPAARWNPYDTGNPGIFLCSSSTPPGGGVHGMCGYWAAQTVLHRVFQRQLPVHA